MSLVPTLTSILVSLQASMVGRDNHRTGAWDLYSSQLFAHKLGLPVWDGDSEGDSEKEIHVGSVVSSGHGRLWPIFNTMRPADDITNRRNGVPDHFELLDQSQLQHWQWSTITHSPIASQSITIAELSADIRGGSLDGLISAGGGINFSWKGNSGALLVLDTPAWKEMIMAKKRITTYMHTHFDNWLSFANDQLGMGLAEDEIWFISSTTKTTRFMSAAFHGDYNNKEGSIRCQFAGAAELAFSLKFENTNSMTASTCHGPRFPRNSASGEQSSAEGSQVVPLAPPSSSDQCNQCIFVHYYKMRKRYMRRPQAIEAGAGPHELPRFPPDESDDERDFEECPPPAPPYDPVDILLTYILDNSEAETAIGSDCDVIAVFKGQRIPDDLKSAIEIIRPPIHIDENGVGTIVDLEILDPAISETSAVATPETIESALPDLTDTETATEYSEYVALEIFPPHLPAASSPYQAGHEKKASVSDHSGSVTPLAASPSSKWAASSSRDTTMIIKPMPIPSPKPMLKQEQTVSRSAASMPAPTLRTEEIMLHWQLCPSSTHTARRPLEIEFDLRKPIKDIIIRDHRRQFLSKLGQSDVNQYLDREVCVSPPLRKMDIHYQAFPGWAVTVQRDDGGVLHVRDVFEAIHEDLQKGASRQDRAKHIKDVKAVSDAFLQRCEESTRAIFLAEQQAGLRRVDLLAGESFFKGLTRPERGDQNFWFAHFGPRGPRSP